MKKQILDYLDGFPKTTTLGIRDIAEGIAIDGKAVIAAIDELKRQGLVEAVRTNGREEYRGKGLTLPQSQAEIPGKSHKPRNKPFTPNGTLGYQVCSGKVKIFLERRASSRTLTLHINDLRELVHAVEKSQ